MKRIVYEREDGGIDIVVPAPRYVAKFASEDEALAAIIAKDVPKGRVPLVCEDAEIPVDRTFRNAWVKGRSAPVSVDMAKARDVWRDKIREARKPLLEALDVDYQRADEVGDTKAKADTAAEKQRLRDMTDDPAIDAAQTPEELKTVWSDILKG